MIHMLTRNRIAILSLAAAGTLWGLTVPLTKLSLAWLGPGWLAAARFMVAGLLLGLMRRRHLRAAFTPAVALSGAIGFGEMIVLQNAGIARTSVSHAALIVGAVPVLVALLAAGVGEAPTRRLGWSGHVLALGGVVLVAGNGGGGATGLGDVLILASVVLSAGFIVVQPRVLAGRDAAAVTALQFAAGAAVAVPLAALTDRSPAAPGHLGPILGFAALTVAGTLLPFWLFAFGQARVSPALAGAFVNLEPLVGAAAGWLAFGDRTTLAGFAGALALIAGIGLAGLSAWERPAVSRAEADDGRSSPLAASEASPPDRRHRRSGVPSSGSIAPCGC
jgi:drug/metabolite transporter (DMT)-like permease